LGVGGFLGVGESLVAVNFDQLKSVDQPIEQKVTSTTQAPTTATKNANLSTPRAGYSLVMMKLRCPASPVFQAQLHGVNCGRHQ
jgi:hypothetical protein